MTLIVVHGLMGSGKTLLLTILGKLTKQSVVANYTLEFPFFKFDLYKFVNAEYSNCDILLDEGYVYLESRDSKLNRNKLASYILFQSRKKNVNLYISVQLNSTIDVRFRELAEIHIKCRAIMSEDNELLGFLYVFMNHGTNKRMEKFLSIDGAKQFFELYDTNEVIAPTVDYSEFMNQNDQEKLCKDLANKLVLERENENITKAKVRTFLFENQQPSTFLDYVYTYAKDLQTKGKK